MKLRTSIQGTPVGTQPHVIIETQPPLQKREKLVDQTNLGIVEEIRKSKETIMTLDQSDMPCNLDVELKKSDYEFELQTEKQGTPMIQEELQSHQLDSHQLYFRQKPRSKKQLSTTSDIHQGIVSILSKNTNEEIFKTIDDYKMPLMMVNKREMATQITSSFYYETKMIKRKLKEHQQLKDQEMAVQDQQQEEVLSRTSNPLYKRELRDEDYNDMKQQKLRHQMDKEEYDKKMSANSRQKQLTNQFPTFNEHNQLPQQQNHNSNNNDYQVSGTQELKMPALYHKSPQPVIKQKIRGMSIDSTSNRLQSQEQKQMNDSFYQSMNSKAKQLFPPTDNKPYPDTNRMLKNPSLITENIELKEVQYQFKQKQLNNSISKTIEKVPPIHSKKISEQISQYPSSNQLSQKRVPDLRYINQSPQKQQVIMNTFLTPIVFVSKDIHMNADYILDSEIENFRNSLAFSKYQKDSIIMAQGSNMKGKEREYLPPLYSKQTHQSPNQSIITVQNQERGFEKGTLVGKRKSRSTVRGTEIRSNKIVNNYSPPSIKKYDSFEEQDETNYEDEGDGQQEEYRTQNQFYESIRVEVPDDYTILDNEIKVLCKKLEFYLQTGNTRLDLTMNTLRLKHPVFRMISTGAFNYLMEKSFLFNLKDNQGAYKQGLKAQKNIYFILFGQFKLVSQENGEIGETLRCGHSIGEEILFFSDEVFYRLETCLAYGGEAALLQINVEDLIKMNTTKHQKGGGTSMIKDFQILMGILFNNYEQKQQWREEANRGIEIPNE